MPMLSRPQTPRGHWLGPVPIFLALLGLLASCGQGDPQDESAKESAFPVRTAIAEEGSLPTVVLATAVAEPLDDATLLASAQVQVLRVRVPLGGSLRKGARVLSVDDSVLQAQLHQASARATQAQDALELRKRELASAESLNSSSISEHDLLRARLGVSSAEADLASAKAGLVQLKDAARRAAAPAPFSGELASIMVQAGDQLTPGAPIARVISLDTLVLRFGATEHDARLLKAGQEAQVSFRTGEGEGNQELLGTVYAISRATDPMSRTWTTEVHVANVKPKIPAGSIAQLRIKAGESGRAVLVPREALVHENGEQVVYRVEGGLAQRVPVALSGQNLTLAAITDGLTAGDRVVTAGQARLKDGSPVAEASP